MARLTRRRDGVAALEQTGPTTLVERASVSVIVPTRNEEQNVATLVQRATKALHAVDARAEIIFVDDSDDDTPRAIRAQQGNGIAVRLVHRSRRHRQGGLSGAVLAGFEEATGRVIAVMDGDLQHPPEILPRLLAPVIRGDAQLSVATRYRQGGGRGGDDGPLRRVASAGARRIVHTLAPRSRPVSDPLGGYFAIERSVVDDVELRPVTSKVLLEILVRGRWSRGHEVPYTEGSREHGRSKAGFGEIARFVALLFTLVTQAGARVLQSALFRLLVGATLVAVAYWYSLRTLVGAWSPTDAATASCIVPLVALPLLLYFARPQEREPAIHDRDVDYVLGLALLAVGLFVLWAFQRHMDVAFWVHRVDLVTLPLFVGGVVVILFGTRMLWRLRFPLLFLFLAWPPVLRAVARVISAPLGGTTRAIVRPIAAWVGDIHVGSNAFTAGTQTVRVESGWHAAAIALIVALPAMAIALVQLRGATRRIAFVVTAAAVAWVLNLICVVFAVFAGNMGNADVARTAVGTPVLLGMAVLALATASLGLPRLARGQRRPAGRRVAVPRLRRTSIACAVVALAAVLGATLTGDLDRFRPLADALGTARASAVTAASLPAGYRLVGTAPKRHSVGPSAARRFTVVADPASAAIFGGASATRPLQVDVLLTHNPGKAAVAELRRYYPLRAYKVARSSRHALGHGVRAQELTFVSDAGSAWSALTWVWPVRHDGAQFERVVLAWGDPVTLTSVGPRPDVRDAFDMEPVRSFARALVAQDLAGTQAR